jgi:hypothetical protein
MGKRLRIIGCDGTRLDHGVTHGCGKRDEKTNGDPLLTSLERRQRCYKIKLHAHAHRF